jgi:threonylcarbamoyladenosine tRNA methylthiotransferase MtaB
MNRKYTAGNYREHIDIIRAYYENPAVTTDVITGFPGESEEDFMETKQFVKSIGFSRVHVFPFSERKGTRAEKMDGKVDVQVRKARARKLITLALELEKTYADGFAGKREKVLFEKRGEGYAEGYTDRYIRVRVQDAEEGALATVLLGSSKMV